MPSLNGIDAVRRLKKVSLRSKVLFLSMHMDVEIATEALRAGASGYVLKHSATDALSHAIWEVMAGRIYVSPRIAKRRDDEFHGSLHISRMGSPSS